MDCIILNILNSISTYVCENSTLNDVFHSFSVYQISFNFIKNYFQTFARKFHVIQWDLKMTVHYFSYLFCFLKRKELLSGNPRQKELREEKKNTLEIFGIYIQIQKGCITERDHVIQRFDFTSMLFLTKLLQVLLQMHYFLYYI